MGTYTANDLLQSTRKLAPWRGPGYASSEGITFVQCIPFRGMNSVVYVWRHKPSPIKRNKDGSMPRNVHKPSFYEVRIEFRKVEFADEPLKADNTWSMIEYKGEKYFFEKPRIDTNPISIRCTCKDFEMRGSYEAQRVGILYGGNPPRYVRKTPRPPEGRPYVNPEHHPMMCKHIYASITRSLTEGWIL